MKGYPTTNEMPEENGYLVFEFPNSPEVAQLILGALTPLTFSYNYYQWGDLTPEETSELMRLIVQEAPYNLLERSVPAPYWEDGAETDDVAPVDDQHWYGYVSEGNFIEDAGVWLVSNFLAASIHPTAAILYATQQRKIRLAVLQGGLPKVVTVYANDAIALVKNILAGDEVVDIDVITGYVDDAVEILTVIEEMP